MASSGKDDAIGLSPDLKEVERLFPKLTRMKSSCETQELHETHLDRDEWLEIREAQVDEALFKKLLSLLNRTEFPRFLIMEDRDNHGFKINLESGYILEYDSDGPIDDIPFDYYGNIGDKTTDTGLPKTPIIVVDKTPDQLVDEKLKSTKKTMAEVAGSLKAKYTEIEMFLRTTYSSDITEGSLSEKEIQALVYTLARVPNEVGTFPKTRTPSRLYDWAVVRATITLPYLSLANAAENAKFDKEFDQKADWGYSDNKFVLPTKESLDDDDTFWGKIADLLNVMGKTVEFTAQKGETVPDLSLTKLTKDSYFGYVYIRLVELSKSPGSATIRTSEKITTLDAVKNHVDYVALTLLYQRDKDRYQNLPLSSALRTCQRSIKRSKEILNNKGKTEIVVKTDYVGTALAERLSNYLDKRVGKSPEAEPFSKFIFEIIKQIISKVDIDYVLPKSYFSAPASVLRRSLRHGPDVTQKGQSRKGATYVPFSFAKSSECSDMPEIVRKTLTSAGSDISKNIDSINSLSILDQNRVIPDASRYILLCYAISDDLRKKWQKEAKVVAEPQGLLDYFKFNPLVTPDKERHEYLKALGSSMIKTCPVSNNSHEQSLIKARVNEIVEKKKSARKQT
jgi:hypothetical protein